MRKIVLAFVIIVFTAGVAYGDDFIFLRRSASVWVLNKVTKKIAFIKFVKDKEIWKSNIIDVPAGFDVNTLKLELAGAKVTSVFLCDPSTGKATMFTVQSDHSILTFPIFDMKESKGD